MIGACPGNVALPDRRGNKVKRGGGLVLGTSGIVSGEATPGGHRGHVNGPSIRRAWARLWDGAGHVYGTCIFGAWVT